MCGWMRGGNIHELWERVGCLAQRCSIYCVELLGDRGDRAPSRRYRSFEPRRRRGEPQEWFLFMWREDDNWMLSRRRTEKSAAGPRNRREVVVQKSSLEALQGVSQSQLA